MPDSASPVPGAPPPVAALRVQRVDDLADLDAYAAAWDALALGAGPEPRLPFATHAWTASHLEHRLAPEERWACHLAWAGDDLVGVLPVVARPHPLLGRRGTRLRVPADFHTRDGDLALAPGREGEVLEALLASARRTEGPWLELDLGGMRPGSPTADVLGSAAHGPAFVEYDQDGRLLSVEGTWDDYLHGLHANFRRNLRKAHNRCHHAGARLRCVSGAEAGTEFPARFFEIERSGWKGEAGTAIAQSASSRAFYEAVVRRFEARGWLEWQLLEMGDRLIAAHLAVRFGRNLVVLRIAYDEETRRLSPGNVLFAEVIERAFETRDVDGVDCVTDQEWHDHWNLARVPYRLARVYRRRPVSLLLGALPRAARPLARRIFRR